MTRLAVVACIASLISSVSMGQEFASSVVPIQIVDAAGKSRSAIGISLGATGTVVGCAALKDGVTTTRMVDGKPTPVAILSVRILENVCVLDTRSLPAVRMASRRQVFQGTRLLALVADHAEPSGYREVTATVARKVDGGHRRVLLVSFHADTVNLDGAPLLTADGAYIGPASHIPGSAREFATPVLELAESVLGTQADPKSSGVAQLKGDVRVQAPTLSPKDQPGLALAYVNLADTYSRTGDFEKAIALVEKWRQIEPDNPAVWIVEAFALNRFRFVDRAMTGVERALKLRPDYLAALVAKVSLLRKLGRGTEAELEAAKIVARTRPSDGLDEAALVSLLISAGRPEEARGRVRSLLQGEPEAAYAHNVACRVESAGRWSTELATEACKSWVEREPDSVAAWSALAHAYFRNARMEDSISASKRALSISIDTPEAWAGLGLASEAKGDVGAATEAEKRISDVDPQQGDQYKRMRATVTCVRQVTEKAYELAAQSCETATRLDPRSSRAFAGLGQSLLSLKRVDEAIVPLERASALDPKFKHTWMGLAVAYAYKRDAVKARTALERLAQLDKPAADALASRLKLP